jgi:hypothetical protein
MGNLQLVTVDNLVTVQKYIDVDFTLVPPRPLNSAAQEFYGAKLRAYLRSSQCAHAIHAHVQKLRLLSKTYRLGLVHARYARITLEHARHKQFNSLL